MLLVVLLTGLTPVAFAQQDTLSRHRIILKIGRAFPHGEFKRTDFKDAYPSLAQDGLLFGAGYIRSLHPFLAVGATAGWRRNAFNLDDFIWPNDTLLVREKRATAWHSVFTLADVYLQKSYTEQKTHNEVTVYLRGSVGTARNTSAALHIRTIYGDINFAESHKVALTYGGTLGVQTGYTRFRFILELGYLTTRPSFAVKDARGKTLRFRQVMGTWDLSAGMTYSF